MTIPAEINLDLSSVALAKAEVITAKCDPALGDWRLETRYPFERLGYFTVDPDSGQSPTINHRSAPVRAGSPIFNRTSTLKDRWAKQVKKQRA